MRHNNWIVACKSLVMQKWRTFFVSLSLICATCAICCLLYFYNHATENMHAALVMMQNNAMISFSSFNTSSGSRPIFSRHNIADRLGDSLRPYLWSGALTQYQPVLIDGKRSYLHHVSTDVVFSSVMGLDIAHGRAFNHWDSPDNQYCLIGSRVAQKLRSSSSQQEITIKNKRYTVIGVLKKQPNKANIPLDINSSIITLMSDNDKNYRPLTTLSVQIAQSPNQDYTQLEGLIRKVFPKQPIYVHDSVQMAKGIERQITNLRYLMLSLGLCCLIISNICVVNCLLATLAERRQEIGIRLSLGASPSQIRDMFLRETTVLAVISAIIGSILAIMLVYGIRFFVGIAVPITFEPLLISFCICVSVAICASCYPAYQAKRLQPIQLMRG